MIYLKKIVSDVKNRAKPGSRILVQLPEGLKTKSIDIINALEREGYAAFFSNDPCYGACDIREREAKMLKCNFIVHLGHKKFFRSFPAETPVIYIPIEIEASYDKTQLAKIKELRVGLLSTVNYSNLIERVADDLRAMDKTPVIGGEILGCNAEPAKAIENRVDCFLFIGTGRFHPIGIKTYLKVYVLDLEKNQVIQLERKDIESEKRIKYAKIEKFRDSRNIGILISSKKGQFFENYEYVKKRVEATGKKAYVIIMDCIKNDDLMGLKIDFFINTACPRIAEDKFDRPIMNAADFLEFYG